MSIPFLDDEYTGEPEEVGPEGLTGQPQGLGVSILITTISNRAASTHVGEFHDK